MTFLFRIWMPGIMAAVFCASPGWTDEPETTTKGLEVVRKKGTGEVAEVKPPYHQVHVLCIGINDYPNLPSLRYSEADAKGMARVLKERYGFRTMTLLGKNATKRNIRAKVAELISEIESRDDVIIYFSGHGITLDSKTDSSYGRHARTGYFAVYPVTDAEVKSPEWLRDNAINMKAFAQEMIKIDARHRCLILDCCFSGHATSFSITKDVAYTTDLLEKPTVQVLTAGTDQEEALEISDLGHGVFTYELMGMLTRESGFATMDEIFIPLRKQVVHRASAFDHQLTPTLRALIESDGDFVFVPIPSRDEWTSLVRSRSAVAVEKEVPDAFVPMTDEELADLIMETGKLDPAELTDEEREAWKARAEALEEKAAVGDEKAMTALVHLYGRGIGTDADGDRAYQWAREAYDTEKPAGLLGMHEAYKEGYGVESDEEEAEKLGNSFAAVGGRLAVMLRSHVFPAIETGANKTVDALGVVGDSLQISREFVGRFIPVVKRSDEKRVKVLREHLEEGAWNEIQDELRFWREAVTRSLASKKLKPGGKRRRLTQALDAQLGQMQLIVEDLHAVHFENALLFAEDLTAEIHADGGESEE